MLPRLGWNKVTQAITYLTVPPPLLNKWQQTNVCYSLHIKHIQGQYFSIHSKLHQLFINAPTPGIDASIMWTDMSPWSSLGCSKLMGRLDFIHCSRHFLHKTLHHTPMTHFIKLQNEGRYQNSTKGSKSSKYGQSTSESIPPIYFCEITNYLSTEGWNLIWPCVKL